MTDQEKQEFIDKVKGKKIRASWYTDGRFVIPNGEWKDDTFFADMFDHEGEKYYEKYPLPFNAGFKPSRLGRYWEFVEKELHFEAVGLGKVDCFPWGSIDETTIKIVLKKCQHEWKDYHGFTESYKYCSKCGVKKEGL